MRNAALLLCLGLAGCAGANAKQELTATPEVTGSVHSPLARAAQASGKNADWWKEGGVTREKINAMCWMKHEQGRSDMPVCAGVGLPLIRPPFTAPETHGDSGLGYARLPASPVGPANEHAVDLIIREIMARPGEVTLVAVAPLTNVALAIRKEPRIVQAVREVIIMGAALRVDGNTTSLAEFNFFVDPHAAHIVLESGMPITLLPWDITKDVLLHQVDVDRLLRVGFGNRRLDRLAVGRAG